VEVDRELVIGRADADISIEDSEVSRRHAALRPVEEGLEVEDLGSTNGTFVNGERISTPITISNGGTIRIGRSELAVEVSLPQATVQAPQTADQLRRVVRGIWGPVLGTEVAVDRELVVGREAADFTIHDPEVSRRHAVLRPVGGGVEVEDLGSTNGTFVNGERIAVPTTLAREGTIRVGTSELAVEVTVLGATRVRELPAKQTTQLGTRLVAAMVPESEAALRIAEGEQLEQEHAMAVAPPAMAPPAAALPDGAPAAAGPPPFVPPPPLPAAAARFGITEENRRWWTLAAMCLGLSVTMLDTTVVNVALPSIQEDLNLSLAGIEWTISAYTLPFAVLLITGGRLGDIFGRRLTFIGGVVLFALASVLIGVAGSEGLLIAGRVLQGVGAAFMMPATLSIITNTFPPPERGRAIGMWAGVSGFALALGPVVGGLLTESVSWRAVFFLNIPIAIAAVALALLAAPESRDQRAQRTIDVLGIVVLSASLAALVLAFIKANDWGWGSATTIVLMIGAGIGLVAFVFVERRVKAPMLQFELFRSRQFVGANIVGFVITFGLLSWLLFLALYLQDVLGYSALGAGVRFLPGTILVIAVAPIAGRLADRIGSRPLMTAGLLLVALSLGIQTQISSDTGYGLLVPAFMIMGLGVGLTLSPMSTAAMNAVRRDKAGVASGILSTSRQLGGTFGIAIVGAILQASAVNSSFVDALGDALILPLVLAILGAIAAFALVTARPGLPGPGGPPPGLQPQGGGGG
jgi:EmrB/QacA subfamily drug resistance transporter